MTVDRLAIGGVNGLADNFATVAEQSQLVDQSAVVMAEPRAHQFGVVAARAPEFDHMTKRDGVVVGNRSALFGPVQAGIGRRVSGQSRRGQKAD